MAAFRLHRRRMNVGFLAFMIIWTAAVFPASAVFGEDSARNMGKKTQASKVALARTDLSEDGRVLEATIRSYLKRVQIYPVTLSADELADSAVLNTDQYDLLIWLGAETYPAVSADNLTRYLEDGGDLIALGAPAFSNPVWKLDGKWVSRQEIVDQLKLQPPAHVVYDFESEGQKVGWERATNNPQSRGEITFPVEDGNTFMNVYMEQFDNWDNWAHGVDPIGADDSVLTFRAKGAPQTSKLMIELVEKDGSRWIASFGISTEWETHALWPHEFRYWPDNPSQGRGGPEDRVRFSNVHRMSIGIALSHVSLPTGEHQFAIDDIGVSPDPLAQLGKGELPVMDGLTPAYKYFPVMDSSEVRAAPNQQIVRDPKKLQVDDVVSVHPRPLGTGIDKARGTRFVPLLETIDARGYRSGYLAWMVVNGDPEVPNRFAGSVWSVFATSAPAAYQQKELAEAVADTAQAMLRHAYLVEGGAQQFAYAAPVSTVKLGVTLAQFADLDVKPPRSIAWRVDNANGRTILKHTERLDGLQDRVPASEGEYIRHEWDWQPEALPAGVYTVTTELLEGGRVLDRLRHELNVWEPKPEADRQYVTVQNGQFQLNGQPWFGYGVNYMPTSGLAQEKHGWFEYFVSKESYDPAHFDDDLQRIRDLGFNLISVFIYEKDFDAMNLLDLLVRAEKYGLKVNLNIRTHADPISFSPQHLEEFITQYRLPENDTLIAYDIAWEREWGTYSGWVFNQYGRQIYDPDWEQWVTEQYGSIAAAEADWGVPIPRNATGHVTGPSDAQLNNDGDWRTMVAAYRRFADDQTAKMHQQVSAAIKEVDPHHLVSFRMNLAGDPTGTPSRMPYEFKALAPSMDFMAPEAYGRLGDWNNVKLGMFTAAYSRYSAPDHPMIWSEAGYSVWSGDNFAPDNDKLRVQGQFYRDFLTMIEQSHADGVVFWWYPGGFRFNENSDYGILNPDGSDRPATEVIREFANRLKQPGTKPTPDVEIPVNRDASSKGIAGIYEQAKDSFWQAIEDGYFPGLTDAGRGMTSQNAPLLAVGDRPYNGANPPKYLNSFFKRVEMSVGDGQWFDVEDGMRIRLPRNEPVQLRAEIVNMESATWIAPTEATVTGSVYMTAKADSGGAILLPILADTAYQQEASIGESVLVEQVQAETAFKLRMTAWDRMDFGNMLTFTLIPDDADSIEIITPVDNGDSNAGWSPMTSPIIVDPDGPMEGSGSLRVDNSELVGMFRRFPTGFATGADVENGQLQLWLYVSDASRIGREGRIEMSSVGQNDADSFNWDLLALNLEDGWNHLVLPFAGASRIGHPDPKALKYIRIYLFVTGDMTLKVDDIQLRNPPALHD